MNKKKFVLLSLKLMMSRMIFFQNPTVRLKALQMKNDNNAAINKNPELPDYFIYQISNEVSF